MNKLKKLRKILKELKEEGFAGTGVSGVAGLGIAVGGDKSQAEPGVNMKNRKKDFPKSPVMSTVRRKLPKV